MPKTLALGLVRGGRLVLGGCERSGSLEEAGEAIDDAVEEVGDRSTDGNEISVQAAKEAGPIRA